MEINSELLRQRMMRGAVTGAPAPEEAPMQYCKGKLDSGRPCRIVVFGGEEYCLRHKKEIEALMEGAPLPPGRMERLHGSPPQEIVDDSVVTLHFREQADRDLLMELKEISGDLEGDILALLHLAAKGR